MKKTAWAFPTESFQQERARTKKRREKGFAAWMGIVKGGPGSGNHGHCGGEGGAGNPGGSRPAGDCRATLEVPEYIESSRDLRKLDEDEEWRDATGRGRKVTVFHFSREDRSETGLLREYAGTAAAGEERQSMEYQNGKLKPESAVVHAYLYGAKREKIVPGAVLHRIDAKMDVIDVGSAEYQQILIDSRELAKNTGRPALAHAREIARSRGYDALVSQRHGMMQILRDVKPEELTVIRQESLFPYKINPSEDVIKGTRNRQDIIFSRASSGGPLDDKIILTRVSDEMYSDGILSSEDKQRITGSLTDDKLKTKADVFKVRDELISAISKNATQEQRDEVEKSLKYGLMVGKSVEQIKAEQVEQMRDVLQGSVPMIRVPMGVAGKVFDDGRFKSQFETNTSGGALNQDYREMSENKTMGVPRDIDGKDRPIYGYAGNKSGSFANYNLKHYGDVAFVLKDNLKSRMTVTFGDSMDNNLAVSDYSNPEIHSLRIGEPGRLTGEDVEYVEIQVHGGVSVNDVEKLIISEGAMKDAFLDYTTSGSKLPPVFEKAAKSGVKIEVGGLRKTIPIDEFISDVMNVQMLAWGLPAADTDGPAKRFIERLRGVL